MITNAKPTRHPQTHLPVLTVDGISISRSVHNGKAELHPSLLNLHRRGLNLHSPLNLLYSNHEGKKNKTGAPSEPLPLPLHCLNSHLTERNEATTNHLEIDKSRICIYSFIHLINHSFKLYAQFMHKVMSMHSW